MNLDQSKSFYTQRGKQSVQKKKNHSNVPPQQNINKTESDNQAFKAQIQSQIEEVKVKQNQEMLKLIEIEEEKERQRESKLNSINSPSEKNSLQLEFAIERAAAKERIESLTKKHSSEIKGLQEKLNNS